MWLSRLRPASRPRESLFSRQCFSCLGVLPILPSTKCSWGWILCRSFPAPLGTVLLWVSSFTCSLWAGAEGIMHFWNLVVGLRLWHHLSLCGVKPATCCHACSSLPLC